VFKVDSAASSIYSTGYRRLLELLYDAGHCKLCYNTYLFYHTLQQIIPDTNDSTFLVFTYFLLLFSFFVLSNSFFPSILLISVISLQVSSSRSRSFSLSHTLLSLSLSHSSLSLSLSLSLSPSLSVSHSLPLSLSHSLPSGCKLSTSGGPRPSYIHSNICLSLIDQRRSVMSVACLRITACRRD
jgi:hypothetical protein